jgi:hypothetical protein
VYFIYVKVHVQFLYLYLLKKINIILIQIHVMCYLEKYKNSNEVKMTKGQFQTKMSRAAIRFDMLVWKTIVTFMKKELLLQERERERIGTYTVYPKIFK